MSQRVRTALDLALAAAATLAYFHALASVPPGYLEDSASVALNAHCLALTGVDEYGVRWPAVAFRSFGDYKGTLNLYALAAVFRLAGSSLFVERVFSVLLSWATTALNVLYLSRPGVLPRVGAPLAWGGLFTTVLLSPWLVVTHRVLLEATVTYAAVSLVLVTLHALLREPGSWRRGLVHGLAVGLLPYAYNPAKVVYAIHLPLVAAVLLLGPRPASSGASPSRLRGLAIAGAVAVALGLPHLWDLLHGAQALSRFVQVGGHFRPGDVLRALSSSFSLDFLFLTGDHDLRHHSGYRGMLNLYLLPLLVAGLVGLARRALGRDRDPFWTYVVLLVPLSFLPATLAARSEPHALRTNVAIGPLTFAAAWGLTVLDRLLVSRLGRRAASGALLAWLAFGLSESTRSLLVLHGEWAGRNLWTFTGPRPRWRREEGKPSYDDHAPETVHERFFRAARGDLGYCGGSRQ